MRRSLSTTTAVALLSLCFAGCPFSDGEGLPDGGDDPMASPTPSPSAPPVSQTPTPVVSAEPTPTPTPTPTPQGPPRAEVVTDRDYLTTAAGLIDGATDSVCLAHFQFNDGRRVAVIRSALVNAAERGIRVRVVVDDGLEFNLPAVQALRSQGVDARVDGEDLVTHNKLIVSDRSRVLLGSTNLSDASIGFNHEANLLLHDPDAVDNFGDYCDALFQTPWERPPLRDALDNQLVPLGDLEYFDAALGLIEGATTRIDIAMFSMRYYDGRPDSPSTQLVDALVAAAQRRVQVRVLLELSDFDEVLNDGNAFTANVLSNGGVEVHRDSLNTIMHAKVLVADDAAILGSTNWSFGSLAEYHASDVLTRIPTLVRQLREYVSALHAAGAPR